MQNELVNSFAQRAFAKEDHSVQAGFFYAANEALPYRHLSLVIAAAT
jgi:hypothetical protein